MILGLHERLAPSKPESTARVPRPDRGDKARVPGPRRRGEPISTACATTRLRSSTRRSSTARRRRSRWTAPRPTRAAGGRRRHGVDGGDRRDRPRRLVYPVGVLGVRLRRGAAGNRHRVAEPRHRLLARSRRRQPAGARAHAVPHPQPGARRARRRRRVLSYGSMGGDGQPQFQAQGLFPLRPRRNGRRRGGGRAALPVRPHLGRRIDDREGRGPLRFRLHRPPCRGSATRSRSWAGPTSTRSAMPACWCAIPTNGRVEATTIRARTGSGRGVMRFSDDQFRKSYHQPARRPERSRDPHREAIPQGPPSDQSDFV